MYIYFYNKYTIFVINIYNILYPSIPSVFRVTGVVVGSLRLELARIVLIDCYYFELFSLVFKKIFMH